MKTVVGATFAFPLEEFQKQARKAAGDVFGGWRGPDQAAMRFLEQIQEDAIAEDLETMSIDDMVFLAARFWSWAQERKPGRTLLRLEPGVSADGRPLHRDILEVVTADKAFLVDSVMGEINEAGVDVLAMFHPIVTLERDEKGRRSPKGSPVRESFIQVHLEPMNEGSRARVLAGVRATLADVDVAVSDYPDMLARMDQAIDELASARTAASREVMEEAIAFLRWLRDDRFAFLGSRVYEFATDASGVLMREEPVILEETGRGVLRDPLRHVLKRGSEPAVLTPQIQEFIREPSPLIVAKSNMRSRVHRRVYKDYVGVKRYRADGEVIGETRFVGLFTAEAYYAPAHDVPLIRSKVKHVLERANRQPMSHSHKLLKNIIQTYPRDELFQTEEDELLEICLGMLHLLDRPRPRLFIRRDRFDRYVSAFVFVPRDRYNSELREQIGELLATAFEGRVSAFYPAFSDGPLARVHFIIGRDEDCGPLPDAALLEQRISNLARTWTDDFVRVSRRSAPAALKPVLHHYEDAFSVAYRDEFMPEEAVHDVAAIESIEPSLGVTARAYRTQIDGDDILRFKLYKRGDPAPLSDVMPTLEAMGMHVIAEAPYHVRPKHGDDGENDAWIHDFEMRSTFGAIDWSVAKAAFEEAFLAIWARRCEDDRFNTLILQLGVPWRDVTFLRACARFRLQTGLDPSQDVQEEAMIEHPEVVRLLLELRRVRFDPDFDGDVGAREAAQAELDEKLIATLDAVESLDYDRVLRRIWRLIHAVKRTNFYQTDDAGEPPAHVSLKIASREVEELPEPKPFREVFVSAPHVEGVHLRFGPVARGGLRWSDRRTDFRTEVLGLVKAQQVKNAVIVPTGAKGGFFPKALPRGGAREEVLAEAIRAYKTFIRGLLDITDNIVEETLEPPPRVVRWDEDDPYLVVAADKGTASFSDIANGVAADYGFWLGDAFASGGSAGYDHKKMGITARGAWVAVQRHFREMGKDIQTEPFTVIGVGDMSGDVFGNGMLLSKKIRLLAAFDHRDIFIDPDPGDPETLWNERKRMFDLPRSTWRDYDASLISKGGGVFSRSQKSIALTPEIKALTGLGGAAVSPNELIAAILKIEAELLWFGGIGTYIRAPGEQDWQVGDKANDAIRIDAEALNAKVIGEGANLGVTQAGRIALARRGVRVNADFIDNAGGVDSSDHEVNIKILVNQRVRSGAMTLEERNRLLAEMTEDVSAHVLQNNYDQTLAISVAESDAAVDLDAYERLIERLEGRGQLDRDVEELPSAEEFRELKEHGLGLTRPEISVLISYAKISLFDRIRESSVVDDPHFEASLKEYFPPALSGYEAEMRGHRLRRELVATLLANDMVNIGGATFAHRARESTGGDTNAVARAFEAARVIFDFGAIIKRIHALDNQAPFAVQRELYSEVIRLLRRQTYWLVRRGRGFEQATPRPLDLTINAYRPGVEELRGYALDVISEYECDRVRARTAELIEAGAPEDLAADVAGLRPLTASSDVIDLAERRGWPLRAAARLYHAFGARFRFDELRSVGGELSSSLHWDRLAVRRLIEDLYGEQQSLVEIAMKMAEEETRGSPASAFAEADKSWADAAVDRFVTRNEFEVDRADEAVREVSESGAWALAKLTIASTALRELATLARS